MGTEIERKFLVTSEEWRQLGSGEAYCQGYLCSENNRTVRVRIIGDRGILTIKGPSAGQARLEYEYEIPVGEAREMLETLCHRPLIEKTRYTIPYQGLIWEVDEFKGENEGLIFAELELDNEGQQFTKPPWIGMEVTGDSRFYNVNLVKYPFSMWPERQKPAA